jgi:transcriptional regulator with XRE-family HTH domain
MQEKVLVKIRDNRYKKNYTQEYMSEKLGVSQSHYAKIENGKVKLKADHLMKILEILEINYSDLQKDD